MKQVAIYMSLVALVLFIALGGLAKCFHSRTGQTVSADSLRVDSVDMVMRLRAQSRLYTSEYRIHKVVTHDDLLRFQGTFFGHSYEKTFQLGDRKVAIPIDVTMKAYVDFSAFSERNVERHGSFVHIILPDPKVVLTSSSVDHAGVRQYTSMLRSGYTDRELTELSAQGVESIIANMGNTDIMERARESAARIIIPLMVQLGYQSDHVVVTFRQGFDLTDPSAYYDNEHSVVKWEGGKR